MLAISRERYIIYSKTGAWNQYSKRRRLLFHINVKPKIMFKKLHFFLPAHKSEFSPVPLKD